MPLRSLAGHCRFASISLLSSRRSFAPATSTGPASAWELRHEETNRHAPQDKRRNETSRNAIEIEIDNDKKTEGDRHG
jgi:hypothetical protein